jgi:hypothetical protein
MSLQIVQNESDLLLADIERTQKMCTVLMKTPHYSKMGEVGIFAIVQKAQSIGMNPLEALNGGMYFVQGKVEMQGQAMLSLIRAKGHSVSLDARTTNTHVIMHGKRVDNGDTWTVEFSIDDAKRAGIFRGQWEKYPKVMCMWRCVSMLSRFLFSDVLKGVYVAGEISDAPAFDAPVNFVEVEQPKVELVSNSDALELIEIISECDPVYQNTVLAFLKKHKIPSLNELPLDLHGKLKKKALEKRAEYMAQQMQKTEESNMIDEELAKETEANEAQ